jgi:hypothetical protein
MNMRKIKAGIMALLPPSLALFYRRKKQDFLNGLGASKDPGKTFSEIYSKGSWGAGGKFDSGTGTSSEKITQDYVSCVGDDLQKLGLIGCQMVDLGCGNFSVGSKLAEFSRSMIAVDVVPSLIEHLRAVHESQKIHFETCDLVCGSLPEGDIAFLRQVLQHLSNKQILQILPKLKKYKVVYITEHLPSIQSSYPNLDKKTGGDIRLAYGSGVYLDLPPFNLEGLEVILECPGHPMGGGIESGVIRTYRYVPQASRIHPE